MFGKFFGGAVGWMVGGPVGALLGVFIGAQCERHVRVKSDADNARTLFFMTAFQAMGYLAKSDGHVSVREITTARLLMDQLGLDTAQQQVAVDCFTEGKQPDFAIDEAVDAFRKAYKGQMRPLQQWLEVLLNLTYADGEMHPHAHARLLHIAERLGLARLQFEGLHAMFRAQRWAQTYRSGQQWGGHTGAETDFGRGARNDSSQYNRRSSERRPTTAVHSLAEAYRVLGITSDAGIDDIKLAYRRLLKQNHPDKLSASGISAAEMARATEITGTLTAAYDYIRQARGF